MSPKQSAAPPLFADDRVIERLQKNGQIALKYVAGEVCEYLDLPANPNGALLNVAAVTSRNGKIFGTMPHPERAMFFTQLPNWQLKKQQLIRAGQELPTEGPGLQLQRRTCLGHATLARALSRPPKREGPA